MPSIILNKTEFEKLVGKELPLEELKDRISMLGTDLEKIESEEIHVEVFPNRPDMLSEQGFARAFSSFIGVKKGLQEYAVRKGDKKVIVDTSVTMRPYTACALVKNLAFTDEKIRELMQVQEKLATTHGRGRKKSAYGIYPADAIKFPVTYTARDPSKVTFKPLGFEVEMRGSEVLEQHPKAQEYAHLTKGWKEYPFFMDADGKILSMLPFTNSEDTGKVGINTRDVFIECTGIDLQNVQIALNIIVTTLADMGGEIESMEIVYDDKTITTPNLTPRQMKLDLLYVNKMLGLDLDSFNTYLEKMGFGIDGNEVLIPAYRDDILHPIDLVEDIAIAYGYENFNAEIPNVATIAEESEMEKFLTKLREVMIGYGLLEMKNYHLMALPDLTEKMLADEVPIVLKNALGEHNTLRNSLLPSLLKNLQENQHHEYPQNIFEIGTAFMKEGSQVREKITVSVALSHEKTDFTEIRKVLDGLCHILGLQSKVREKEDTRFITGRVGEIVVNDIVIGVIGEIHPQCLTNWEITTPVVGFEIDVERLMGLI